LGEELPGVRNLNDILDQYTDHRTSRGEVFAILEKDDTFISYCQNFELAKEPSMSKTEAELKLEQTLEAQKAEFTALKAEKEALEKEKAELAQFKLEADKKAAADAIALQEQKLKTFVADLKGKKLLTPATEKIVEQLAGESAEFSFEDKKLTKEEMFEKLLTLTSEAAKVNFEESSLAEYAKAKDKGDENKKDEKAISEYMEKEKCSYQAAYKAVMKAKAK
jgi:hypothetical protein